MIGLTVLMLALAEPATSDAAAPGDIVVVAERGRCRLVYAGSQLDGRGLQRLANGWPEGRPLRVIEPRGAKAKCLAKITLDLSDKGFRLIEFVDPPER